jgi:hypothetical protein
MKDRTSFLFLIIAIYAGIIAAVFFPTQYHAGDFSLSGNESVSAVVTAPSHTADPPPASNL